MRNTEKVRHSTASNLLVQYPLAELTLQLTVDPSKSRRLIPARADGCSQHFLGRPYDFVKILKSPFGQMLTNVLVHTAS
jgi:hypothetical protein